MKLAVRREQDYWLSFLDAGQRAYYGKVTEAQRAEFLRFDSQGGAVPEDNPIHHGKRMHGFTISEYRSSYLDWRSWPGGAILVEDWLADDRNLRPLVDAFGTERVEAWLDSWVLTRL